MNYLAIDTSGSYLTVAASGKRKSVIFIPDCGLTHSVILMDEVEKCLADADAELKDIDVFACAVGPGSFTGIRIGVSTVKAFAYAENKKVLSVTSFLSSAYNIVSDKRKLVLIDARHGNFYACGFSAENDVVLPPCFLKEEEVKKIADNYVVISDSDIAVPHVKANVAEGFVKAVEDRLASATYDREYLVPLYVKKSQAEEES